MVINHLQVLGWSSKYNLTCFPVGYVVNFMSRSPRVEGLEEVELTEEEAKVLNEGLIEQAILGSKDLVFF